MLFKAMQIYPLSEGVFTIGHDKIFVPFDESKDVLTDRPTGSLLVEIQPFLVKKNNELIVLDTGLGFSKNGTPQIHQNLRALGFEPGDVTKVLLSHLHKDHAGGLMHRMSTGASAPMFPNATYYIHRQEADFALSNGKPSYMPEEIEPLLQTNQIHWLDGEEGEIGYGISWWHSGGHAPWHIVWLLEEKTESGNSRLFFGGDEAPQLRQLKYNYVAKYDHDGRRASQLRKEWAETGKAAGWEFLFYHDVKTPSASL